VQLSPFVFLDNANFFTINSECNGETALFLSFLALKGKLILIVEQFL
jgi:hypothetical protein